ncbi:C40 family peptidase [Collimonas humicola]|uniref:C40 family peptidase n=1 Tax=Collimonas humicola TaxID=2825886 RepID=UPI001B8C357E|nr:C40 family peptidase [Collimonas humicola]
MNRGTERAIRAHAVRDYPRECCGLVIKVGRMTKYIPCTNIASNDADFRLAKEDYVAAADMGEILAVVHSHPDRPPLPSPADLDACEEGGVPWHIVHVSKDDAGLVAAGEIHTFAPSGYEAPLLGLPFVHGVHDCYALIRRWYKQERGIVLPDFERRDGWWDDGVQNLYLDNYAKAGFEVVPDGVADLQVGDVILMQIRSKHHPNHAGVYIDGGWQWMIHHEYGQLSCKVVYGGHWLQVTRAVLRYRSEKT